MFMYAPKKLESLSPKDALCQVVLILVREKKIFKFVNIFSFFRKGVTLHLDKLEFPPPKDALCLVEIGLVVLKKKMTMGKVYKRTTDNWRSEKLTCAFGSGELKRH